MQRFKDQKAQACRADKGNQDDATAISEGAEPGRVGLRLFLSLRMLERMNCRGGSEATRAELTKATEVNTVTRERRRAGG